MYFFKYFFFSCPSKTEPLRLASSPNGALQSAAVPLAGALVPSDPDPAPTDEEKKPLMSPSSLLNGPETSL